MTDLLPDEQWAQACWRRAGDERRRARAYVRRVHELGLSHVREPVFVEWYPANDDGQIPF